MYSCTKYVCTSSDKYENIEFAVVNRLCQLVPLNFITYEMCGDTKQLELGVHLFDFDMSKLSVSRCSMNEENFDVLHDGKKFRLFLKAFDGKIKRSRCFSREKHLKIRDVGVNRMLWEVFWNIEELARQAENNEKKFCLFLEWHRIWLNFCDKIFTPRHIYHFEEAAVAIDKVVMIKQNEYEKNFSSNS